MRNSQILLVAIAALAPLVASAQDSTRPNLLYNDPNMSSNLPIQKVGPEDLLSINVYDSPEFTRTVRVYPDGTIRLPMLKSTIPVSGLFPTEIQDRIAEKLKQDGLLVDPFVTVNVSEYHSRPVSVTGSVKFPTVFQAVGTGNDTLLDALAKAQGVLDTAGPDIIVTSPNGPDGQKSVRRIGYKALMAGTDPSLNLKLSGGEEINVPPVLNIVVEGSVTKPGVYPVLDPISTNTVTTAIAQAGGLIQYAEHIAYIYRTDSNGTQHTITVPLWDIQNRKKPDIQLQAKDILYVPDSPKRRITQETVNALTGFGSTAAAGVIVAVQRP